MCPTLSLWGFCEGQAVARGRVSEQGRDREGGDIGREEEEEGERKRERECGRGYLGLRWRVGEGEREGVDSGRETMI
jgi:hypothetical protein